MIVESVFEQFRSVDDVAIIGMACLFPGAPSVRAYWENIVGKVCTIGDPPLAGQTERSLTRTRLNRTAFTAARGDFYGTWPVLTHWHTA